MKFKSSTLTQSILTGMGIGFPVTLVCMTAIGGFNSVILEFGIWMVASALFGLLSGFLFFSKTEFPFPAVLGLHFMGCFAVTVKACSVAGYSDNLMELITSILPVFVIVYVIIYGICFAIMKHNEKKINEALNQK